MHELPILQDIVSVVLKHSKEAGASRVLAVDLEVGELRDLDEECMQRYFAFVSEGTAAADATLRIRRSPALFSCRSCGSTFPVDLERADASCPTCSSTDIALSGGNELCIESIDVI